MPTVSQNTEHSISEEQRRIAMIKLSEMHKSLDRIDKSIDRFVEHTRESRRNHLYSIMRLYSIMGIIGIAALILFGLSRIL